MENKNEIAKPIRRLTRKGDETESSQTNFKPQFIKPIRRVSDEDKKRQPSYLQKASTIIRSGLRNLSPSYLARKLECRRRGRNLAELSRQLSEAMTECDYFNFETLEEIKKKSAKRQKQNFQNERTAQRFAEIDKLVAEERQRRNQSIRDVYQTNHDKVMDPLAIAIWHWYRQDVPALIKEVRQMVVDLNTENYFDQKSINELLTFLDQAEPNDFFPHADQEISKEDLPPLPSLPPEVRGIYDWIQIDCDVRHQTLLSIVRHKSFGREHLSKLLFEKIWEMQDEHHEFCRRNMESINQDAFCHIDFDKLRNFMEEKIGLSEALVRLWKEIRLLAESKN